MKPHLLGLLADTRTQLHVLILHVAAPVSSATHVPCCCVQRLGIDTDSLFVCQPDYGELAFNVMDDFVRSGSMSLIVVDSVSALVPRSEIEGDIGTPQVGSAAGLVGWHHHTASSHCTMHPVSGLPLTHLSHNTCQHNNGRGQGHQERRMGHVSGSTEACGCCSVALLPCRLGARRVS